MTQQTYINPKYLNHLFFYAQDQMGSRVQSQSYAPYSNKGDQQIPDIKDMLNQQTQKKKIQMNRESKQEGQIPHKPVSEKLITFLDDYLPVKRNSKNGSQQSKSPLSVSQERQSKPDNSKQSLQRFQSIRKKYQQGLTDMITKSESIDIWNRGCLSILAKITSAGRIFLNKSEKFRFRNLKQRDLEMIDDRSSNFDTLYNMGLLTSKPNSLEKLGFSIRKNYNQLVDSIQVFKMFNMLVSRFIIKPDSLVSLSWGIIVLLFLLLNFILMTFRIVFQEKFSLMLESKYYLELPFYLFIADTFISLNTAFYKNGILCVKRSEILKKYITTDFSLDLMILAAIFFSKILKFFLKTIKIFSPILNLDTFVELTNFQWINLLILATLPQINTIVYVIGENLQLQNQNEAIFQMFQLFLKIALTAHICGCFFIYITKFQDPDKANWMSAIHIDKFDWSEQYITALYWAVVTMITLGYGDIIPVNPHERMVAILIAFIACGMFAYSFNKIGIIFQSINQTDAKLKQNISKMSNYLRKRGVNRELQMKINRYYTYILNEEAENQLVDNDILQQLNLDLRNQLSQDIYLRMLKESKPFYLNFSIGVLQKLAMVVKEEQYLPETQILKRNDINDKFYFLLEGEIDMYYPKVNSKEQKHITHLTNGGFFGKQSFFTTQKELYTYMTQTIVNIAYIKREQFIEILKQFPSQYEKFCMKKDQFILCQNQGFDLQCQICSEFKHTPENCPRLQYKANRERAIFKFNNDYTIEKNRTPYLRKRGKYINSMMIIQQLHFKIADLLKNVRYFQHESHLNEQIELIYASLACFQSNKQENILLKSLKKTDSYQKFQQQSLTDSIINNNQANFRHVESQSSIGQIEIRKSQKTSIDLGSSLSPQSPIFQNFQEDFQGEGIKFLKVEDFAQPVKSLSDVIQENEKFIASEQNEFSEDDDDESQLLDLDTANDYQNQFTIKDSLPGSDKINHFDSYYPLFNFDQVNALRKKLLPLNLVASPLTRPQSQSNYQQTIIQVNETELQMNSINIFN